MTIGGEGYFLTEYQTSEMLKNAVFDFTLENISCI
jgi:hypothetical protein